MKLALVSVQLALCLLFSVSDGTEVEKRTEEERADVKAFIAELISDITGNQCSLTEAFSMMHQNTEGTVTSDDIRQALRNKFGPEPNMQLCRDILSKIDPTSQGYTVPYAVFFEAIA